MIFLFVSLLVPFQAHAALPKLGFAKLPVNCEMSWSSGTAYVPVIADAKQPLKLKARSAGSHHYVQEIVKNSDAEAGPLWSGGIQVSEIDAKNISAGIFLRDAEGREIAGSQLVVPPSSKKFPEIQLSVRVPESEEKKSEERHYTTLELRCFTASR